MYYSIYFTAHNLANLSLHLWLQHVGDCMAKVPNTCPIHYYFSSIYWFLTNNRKKRILYFCIFPGFVRCKNRPECNAGGWLPGSSVEGRSTMNNIWITDRAALSPEKLLFQWCPMIRKFSHIELPPFQHLFCLTSSNSSTWDRACDLITRTDAQFKKFYRDQGSSF